MPDYEGDDPGCGICDGVDRDLEQCQPCDEIRDGIDNHCDGLLDEGCPRCEARPELCDDGVVDDGCPEQDCQPEV